MICDHCKNEFEPRAPGRPQRFCPGGDCRRAFFAEARRVGADALRHHPGTAKLTAEDRARKAKDKAVDMLAAYIEKRRREIAAGSPRLIDIAARSLTAGPDRSAAPVPPVEAEPRAEASQVKETVRETPGDRDKTGLYEETQDLYNL
jgi:hypothetical protein